MPAADPDRPRDAAGRPQSDRPRDALGRPLAWDADPALIAERESEDVVRSPTATVGRARELLAAGQPFNAHDVFEAAWKHGPPQERDLWQGLAQLCVAVTHRARGNESGATALAQRGADRLRAYAVAGGAAYGLDLVALITWADGPASPTAELPL